MPEELREIAGHRCVLFAEDGAVLNGAPGARDLIEAAMSHRARVVAVPVSRLDETFFQLRSGFAGELLQKAVNYRLKLAIVGDVSPHVATSNAFRDLVIESERGHDVFFVSDLTALAERLGALQTPSG
jgi:hypothetical protein